MMVEVSADVEIAFRFFKREPSPEKFPANTVEDTFTLPYTSKSYDGALQLTPILFVKLSM